MNNLDKIKLYIESLSNKLPIYYSTLKYTKPQKHSNLIRIISVKKYNAEVFYTISHHKHVAKFL